MSFESVVSAKQLNWSFFLLLVYKVIKVQNIPLSKGIYNHIIIYHFCQWALDKFEVYAIIEASKERVSKLL